MGERFDAPSIDEVLIAYLTDRLPPDGRRAVEARLADDALWRSRLGEWRAISAGVRHVTTGDLTRLLDGGLFVE